MLLRSWLDWVVLSSWAADSLLLFSLGLVVGLLVLLRVVFLFVVLLLDPGAAVLFLGLRVVDFLQQPTGSSAGGSAEAVFSVSSGRSPDPFVRLPGGRVRSLCGGLLSPPRDRLRGLRLSAASKSAASVLRSRVPGRLSRSGGRLFQTLQFGLRLHLKQLSPSPYGLLQFRQVLAVFRSDGDDRPETVPEGESSDCAVDSRSSSCGSLGSISLADRRGWSGRMDRGDSDRAISVCSARSLASNGWNGTIASQTLSRSSSRPLALRGGVGATPSQTGRPPRPFSFPPSRPSFSTGKSHVPVPGVPAEG